MNNMFVLESEKDLTLSNHEEWKIGTKWRKKNVILAIIFAIFKARTRWIFEEPL